MTIRTREPSHVKTLQQHFDAAVALGPAVLAQLKQLAKQLDELPVLPVETRHLA